MLQERQPNSRPKEPQESSDAVAYPRECGEAIHPNLWKIPVVGLSPRVRGSQTGSSCETGHDGSIPASAGKPTLKPRIQPQCWVYPRECGEAL